ncbi:MAG: transposase [Desulfobacteraceae bacterium]|nr:transposase [Desulfobacteraceae bacterium]
MRADKIKKVYADKGYTGAPNRRFLALNNIKDGIMRKNNINAKLTDFEIERNKCISKLRYIVQVEASVTRRSPHRSVRAEFPHTVPRF